MSRKIKVRKSLGNAPVLYRVERSQNYASKLSAFPVLVNPPHTALVIDAVCEEALTFYGKHLNGDKDATIQMNAKMLIIDGYYYDSAEYVEKIANQEEDASLPVSIGFELYAERSSRGPKSYDVTDGDHQGEIVFEFPVIEKATAYSIAVAEVFEGRDPVFVHENSCSITSYLITGKKSNTQYLLRVAGVFPDGEGAFCDPINFRTKDWQ